MPAHAYLVGIVKYFCTGHTGMKQVPTFACKVTAHMGCRSVPSCYG
uniref:Uncharacterized protein n=1 Tax=Anguilla anguilla TaxID=7936 RepID=A0A0E9VPU1_ANGAN